MSTTKVHLGVVFSAKELELEVEGEAGDVLESLTKAIGADDKFVRITDSKGKTVVVPTDKLTYIEVEDGSRSGGIGFMA